MQVQPRLLNQGKYGVEVGLRPNTLLHRWIINFIFNDGGLGDFVNYSAATLWVAKNCPWVEGRVYTPRYLTPLMKDIHQEFPTWKMMESESASTTLEHKTCIVGPNIVMGGVNQLKQFLTCMGAHPVDVAFGYYAGSAPAPKDCVLPVLDYPKNDLFVDQKYAVIPCGHTATARKTSGKELNPIIKHIKSLGITPVFLGKKDLLMDGVTSTKFADDILYSEGIDLRDQTTIKEAAAIMQHAEFTVGLDCGLLHLAALMKDSKIIFGYNITSIEHREPRRNHGRHINIALTESELQCIGCQSKLKHVAKHKFSECLYGDSKCIEILFDNNSARWIEAIDRMAT